MLNSLTSKIWRIRQYSTILFKKDKYECPLCGYVGAFLDVNRTTGYRKNCLCPRCNSMERHRLQKRDDSLPNLSARASEASDLAGAGAEQER